MSLLMHHVTCIKTHYPFGCLTCTQTSLYLFITDKVQNLHSRTRTRTRITYVK